MQIRNLTGFLNKKCINELNKKYGFENQKP
jgi:hypothetical protein